MMIILEAVVEAPISTEETPWQIGDLPVQRFLQVSGSSSTDEISAIVQQLAQYNHLALTGSAEDVVSRIVAADSLILPGGIRVRDGSAQVIIEPGCCCGLEHWREWIDLEHSDYSPWWGHDPEPWVERCGATFRFWSDGDAANDDVGPALELPVAEYPRLLNALGEDIESFSHRLEAWAGSRAPHFATELRRRFWDWFGSPEAEARRPGA